MAGPHKAVDTERAQKALGRRVDLFSRLSECVTEADVEKFYIKLMELIDTPKDRPPNMDAMKMLRDLIVPAREKHEFVNKSLPELAGGDSEMKRFNDILSRYLHASSARKLKCAPVAPVADSPAVERGAEAREGPVRPGDGSGE